MSTHPCLGLALVLSLLGAGSHLCAQETVVTEFKKDLSDNVSWTDILKRNYCSTKLDRKTAASLKEILWKEYVARLKKERAQEHQQQKITLQGLTMKYTTKLFGKKPAKGHSLWISMHGGGGAPEKVNNQQWENQKKLYQLTEGIYLTPRAPTNTWNLWHQGHIDVMFERLIQNYVLFEGVDPNRIYIMGYSAGGDGVYQLAPRLADRLAGAAMMAGHPNDASPLGLRNIAFALQVGGKDAAYNRNKVAREWGQKLAQLRKEDNQGYVHYFKIHEDKGHWMDRLDAQALPWLAQFSRSPYPERVVWNQASPSQKYFYWLHLPEPTQDKKILLDVTRSDKQRWTVTQALNLSKFSLLLNDEMVNLDQDIVITSNEAKVLALGRPQRTLATMIKTLLARGDKYYIFSAEYHVPLAQ